MPGAEVAFEPSEHSAPGVLRVYGRSRAAPSLVGMNPMILAFSLLKATLYPSGVSRHTNAWSDNGNRYLDQGQLRRHHRQ
jgi:hypothetical protein